MRLAGFATASPLELRLSAKPTIFMVYLENLLPTHILTA
jgi:hypothetical protein